MFRCEMVYEDISKSVNQYISIMVKQYIRPTKSPIHLLNHLHLSRHFLQNLKNRLRHNVLTIQSRIDFREF